MLLAHPPTRLSACPRAFPLKIVTLLLSGTGALGAASSLAAPSYTAAPGGVAGRVRCRRLAAAVTDLAIVAALTAAIVTASAALTVDAASAFAGAIIALLGPQRIGRAPLPPGRRTTRLSRTTALFTTSTRTPAFGSNVTTSP
eukprot:scaffold27369_cov69-Phaeocystis_antarctica.AAC.2